MNHAFRVAAAPIYRAGKQVRNGPGGRFIKRLRCMACGATRNIDPCRSGMYWLSQNASDLRCVPLSRKVHDQLDRGLKALALLHHSNLAALIQKLNHWELRQRNTL
jgi:hypothetical protein